MIRKILSQIPNRWVLPIFAIGGLIVGLGAYTVYVSRAYSYLSDNPAACVNCHVMSSYYQSWDRSSHARYATCNDCHVPHDSVLSAYAFKAKDGLYHAAVFTMRSEPQVIRPRDESKAVIMENCIRCHTELNTHIVNTGRISFADVQKGEGKACWDCHTQVPHTNISNLASSPGAIVPLPASPVPDWLKAMMNSKPQGGVP